MNTTTNIIVSDFDGGYCFIDQDNPMIQIAAYVNNKYLISTDGGSNFVYLEKNDRGEFINQWIMITQQIFYMQEIVPEHSFDTLVPAVAEEESPNKFRFRNSDRIQ
jgi:hypothetical protein